jgi:hypothetical protein
MTLPEMASKIGIFLWFLIAKTNTIPRNGLYRCRQMIENKKRPTKVLFIIDMNNKARMKASGLIMKEKSVPGRVYVCPTKPDCGVDNRSTRVAIARGTDERS